jgi:hypothetical protein
LELHARNGREPDRNGYGDTVNPCRKGYAENVEPHRKVSAWNQEPYRKEYAEAYSEDVEP